ncbi:MAG: DedA family protein [bacterium]
MLHILRNLISHYGLFGMFVSVAIENLGLPLPTEPAYLVGQALITDGSHSWWVIQVVLYLGHTAGACASYWMGRRIGIKMKGDHSQFTDTQKRIAGWFEKYGYITVFATRLIGYVRPWSSYVAGIAEVPFVPFLLLSSAGTIILNLICLAFASKFIWLWASFPIARILITFSCLIGVVLLAFQGYRKHMTKKNKQEA